MTELPAPPRGWPQLPPGISLCMIVRDEEVFLGDALESVRGVVDEICIVDTGSTDRTVEIATAAGARVRNLAWENDFSKARNASLEMATKRWILVLDADETLSPNSRELVRSLRTKAAHLTGLWLRCYNLSDDFRGTGAMSNAIVRIFPNHERLRYRNVIHEFIALDGSEAGMPAVLSPVEIVHRGYLQDVMRSRRKDERNLALSEAALERAPEDPFNWYNYATSAVLAKKPDVAVSALEKMRELNAGRIQGFIPTGLSLLANLYLNEGRNPQKAESIAREVLTKTPTFANAHFTLGLALAAQRRFKEAREALVAAIEDGKHWGEHFYVDDEVPQWKAHCEIGGTLMEEGGYDLALAWFEQALKVRPKVQPVRLNRAKCLEYLGRHHEARDALAAVWEDDRDTLSANEYLNFLLRRGMEREARAFIDAAAESLEPETRLILYGSAAALSSRAGERSAAEGYLHRALAVEGIEHHRERLRALLGHFKERPMLELLEKEAAR
ncbi:MAG: glycosyltransferase [Candidatus Eremiobacteraeota bacterium]|nr:glycosyltransferase [Candidatus Eremiobacteraeota bacterium]